MDENAPIPPPLSDLHLRREINTLEKKITDLLVVIDTAQAALRRPNQPPRSSKVMCSTNPPAGFSITT